MDGWALNMAWGDTWDDNKPAIEDDDIVNEAHARFKYCEDWEANARINFDFDYKFANGDTHNKFQWDNELILRRETEDKPVLTVNKVRQHNLMIINDAKQNKPGIRIRPVSDEATFEAAQVYQELIYHTEYISSAEHVYDSATTWQVEAGIGYWRILTEYINNKSFDQEAYIRRIKDPRSVYKDPDVNEIDTSDARYGFIFEDMKRDLYEAKYPNFKDIGSSTVLGNASQTWYSKNHVRIAEYYRKNQEEDKLVAFINQKGGQEIGHYSDLTKEGKAYYNSIPDDEKQERDVLKDTIEWFKIAGTKIIDRGEFPGEIIPIVPLIGVETVIDGVLDRSGHTRALINPQQIYNWNTSANQEYGALQTKSPFVAASAAIEGYEEYYKTANSVNHSYIPYNHIDDDGKPIPPPARTPAPQGSPAYTDQMRIAEQEMMMASGQYQSQFGENENAKSGVAINARQRQGDRATYHFIDNQAIAVALTGKILIGIYPHIYDTERVIKITGRDGKKKNIQINPEAKNAFSKTPENTEVDPAERIEEIMFNPNVGTYDIQADTGPSFATKRIDAFNALTQIAAQNKEFMNTIGGDIYFKNADFPGADILEERYSRIIPSNVRGEGPDPQTERLMQDAGNKIEQMTQQLTELGLQLKNKDGELSLKERELALREKEVAVAQQRLDYEAETKRLAALGNSGPGISIEQIQPVLKQLLAGMIANGELVMDAPGVHEGGTVPGQEEITLPGADTGQGEALEQEEEPPMEGAEKADDGNWYIANPEGGYSMVEMQQ